MAASALAMPQASWFKSTIQGYIYQKWKEQLGEPAFLQQLEADYSSCKPKSKAAGGVKVLIFGGITGVIGIGFLDSLMRFGL